MSTETHQDPSPEVVIFGLVKFKGLLKRLLPISTKELSAGWRIRSIIGRRLRIIGWRRSLVVALLDKCLGRDLRLRLALTVVTICLSRHVRASTGESTKTRARRMKVSNSVLSRMRDQFPLSQPLFGRSIKHRSVKCKECGKEVSDRVRAFGDERMQEQPAEKLPNDQCTMNVYHNGRQR